MVNKKGAIELSMTTVVVIVLAMAMLILGLVLVRTIFTGATENVQSINQNVKAQIDKLFTSEDQVTALFLSNNLATIKQGETFGVAFAVKNLEQATTTASTLSYKVKASSVSGCGDIDTSDKIGTGAGSWISGGKTISSASVSPGSSYYGIVLFSVPLTAPLGCTVTYTIDPITGTNPIPNFNSITFFVKITPK